MADQRTFVLIGNFTDNITPALEKINKSLDKVKSNIQSLSKVTTPLKNDFKELADHSKDFSKSLKGQASDIRAMTSAMRSFRNEMGRVNRAYRAGGSRMLRQAQTPVMPPSRPSRGGGGGGGYSSAVAGGIAGTQLADMMTSAIVSGFQIGVRLMEAPFEYFARSLKERISDEMSDIRAAGGLFAINRLLTDAGKQGFLTGGFREAEEVTKENNRYLAKLAGSLPGDTQEYIQVSKQISDGIYRILSQDKDNFMKLGEKFATQEGRIQQAQAIRGGGVKGMQAAGTEVLGEMTKLSVLAGLGGRQGPYGLPQLIERMMAQQTVSMGQMQRYAAIFRDPMIMGALERNIDKINTTQANTANRLEAMRDMLTEIVTPELVARYRRSTAGVLESLRTTFMNPEVGLLGLGRPIEGLGKKFNDFGQMLDKQGNVTESVTQAATADLSVFEGLRDVFAFLYQTLEPIVEIIPMLYDPLKALGIELSQIRDVAAAVFRRFNEYRVFFEEMGGQFKSTARLRASMATLTQLFKDFGIIDSGKFKSFQNTISTSTEFGVEHAGIMLKEMLEKFFDSKLAQSIGETLGRLIGTILSEVANATKFVSGVAKSGGFAGGFASAFKDAGGFTAIQDIFMSIVKLFIDALVTAITQMPMLSATVAALAILPTIIGAAITSLVERCMGRIGSGACPMPGGGRGGRGGRGGAAGSFFLGSRNARGINRFRSQAGTALAPLGPVGMTMMGMTPKRSLIRQRGMLGGAARGLAKAGRFVPGGALAAGGISAALGIASGENPGTAIAKAAVTTITSGLGAAVGTVIAPGIGTAVGGVLGGIAGDWLAGIIMPGQTAAQKQLEAANKQMDAAAAVAQTKYGPDFAEKLSGVEALNQAIGGGAGLKAYAEAQLKSGAISPEQAQQMRILGDEMSQLNVATAEVDKAQSRLATATKLRTGEEDKFKRQLAAAKDKQKVLMDKISSNWDSMSSQSRILILSGADNLKAALDEAAGKVRGKPGSPRASSTSPGGIDPSSTNESRRRGGERAGSVTTPGSLAGPAFAGRLGDAISSELRNKPPGSKLVIANSSETVIPAAGGTGGIAELIQTFRIGFVTMVSVYEQAQKRQEEGLKAIRETLTNNQIQTNTRLQKLETKFTSPGAGGLGGGSIGGGVDSFTSIAQRYGLQMTSGYRPGDPGWHGANRARDYSNSTGPTPQMMQFAQFLAANYGKNLKELIYTPLGYSIKNGMKVPPIAAGSHYNHVHVAYATGYGMPFTSAIEAMRYERAMVPGSVKIGSVTGNSAEGFGGSYTISNNIVIQQQPGQDPEELAAVVVQKMGEWVSDARASSIFV